MAAPARTDPLPEFNFIVEIDGIPAARFAECSGLSSETAVIEYREGGEPLRVRKLPGLTKYPPVTLKRGFVTDRSLWQWRQRVTEGRTERRSGSIILLDPAGQEVARFNFVEGWPSRWEGPHLRARSNEVAIETLEIVHEGLEWAG
jgi:phage tail-like protein